MGSARSGGTTPVRKPSALLRFAKWLAPFFTILFFSPLLPHIALAQDAVYQRTFPVSVGEATAAVQKIRDSSKGRLPTLEGFVQQADQPTERFDKGYFECAFHVSPIATGGTLVRATAKVTAWYNDPAAIHSGYRVLVSNGRLENDVLDSIAEVIAPPAGSTANSKIASPGFPGSTTSRDTRTSAQGSLILPAAGTNWNAHAGPPLYSSTAGPSVSPSSATNLESAKAMRAAEEKKARELSNYIQSLEEIQRNQSYPSDLAAVKKTRTRVLAKPSEGALVLMEADAQDEFQVLGVDGVWVHVQISGASRGWVRRSELEMPLGFSQTDNTSPESPSNAIFRVAKEEITSFRGNWQPLKGKPVRIEWVEPTNSAISTSRKDKLAYAKSVFLRASKSLAQSQPSAEGIVVVFDSADGGQIAAPLSSVEALADRTISEAAFWRQCSLDPQESFIDSTNP
jgi:hypothetical protein